ncbi:Paladin [Hondaea fermentalgiana]|uniref:Paladin n=1 Tax=Hondaea fermentalgiana TaxID=2315210 RepID=A0A2R5GFT4_9STRA|nr:Paladin [Hondaea fermentalgiana]|eukprot:GBG29179.1 Paladin [Hondaea fermentalgiana]
MAPGKEDAGTITASELQRARSAANPSRRRMMMSNSSEAELADALSEARMPSVQETLQTRHGSVLDSRSILKTDYIPQRSAESKSSDEMYPVRISGTWNLRQSQTTQIFGCAQPTVPGIRGVLNVLGAGRFNSSQGNLQLGNPKLRSVLWISLREEPAVYINGRSTVLRDTRRPFSNMDQFQGIDTKRLEDLERRLKEDVVAETLRYGGNVLLHEEDRRRELEANWEALDLDDIKTPDEVFFTFRMQGYRVQYRRIPTTPEKAPSPKFFDDLLDTLMRSSPENTLVVFNCASGGGRSTIAMVAAGLIHMWRGVIRVPAKRTPKLSAPSMSSDLRGRNGMSVETSAAPATKDDQTTASSPPSEDHRESEEVASPPANSPKIGKGNDEAVVRVLSGVALSSMETDLQMPDESAASELDEPARDDDLTRQLEAGWYQPVLHLIRLIHTGREAKRHVDFFCEDASHLVDLRGTIFVQRSNAGRERHQPSELFKMQRAATSLHRYVLLIAFDAYMAEQVSMMMSGNPPSPRSTSLSGALISEPSSGSSHFRFDGNGIEGITSVGEGRLYAEEPAVSKRASRGSFPSTFARWIVARPEIGRVLRAIEDDPEKALEAVDTSADLKLSGGLADDVRAALAARRGSMLNTDTLLKNDHFSSGLVDRTQEAGQLDVSIRGAPNFRNVDGTPVYGVCTPTVDAASEITMYIQNASNAKRVCWTNLREEPLVYINKQPFVLRSTRAPFRNVHTFVAIDAERLEAAELRLKQDILAEAAQYGGRILVHSERDDRSLKVLWESISDDDDVLTPREMYASLMEAGLPVDYARVPMTPEETASAADIDALLMRLRSNLDVGTHFVFHCQMGRGRSTMAMAIALMELERRHLEAEQKLAPTSDDLYRYLLNYGRSNDVHSGLDDHQQKGSTTPLMKTRSHVRGDSSMPRFLTGNDTDDEEDENTSNPSMSLSLRREGGSKTPPLSGFPPTNADTTESEAESEEDISLGAEQEFGVMLSLIRVLSKGKTAKKWADLVIDRCGAVENIRLKISESAIRASKSRTNKRAAEFVERGLINLRRYFTLVLIAAYEISVSECGDRSVLFSSWYFGRPELKTIFHEIKGEEALQFASDSVLSAPPTDDTGAVPLAAAATASGANGANGSTTPTGESARDPSRDVLRVVAQRNGKVLTRGAIAKSDHFPGCSRLKQSKVQISGAPNFRRVAENIAVYGTGIPTVEGLRGILKHVTDSSDAHICWISLREEPIIYINGRPFVLRKLEHPFGNLEFTGISRQRVEDMEERLKEDIISEVYANDGSFLVHDEDETGLQPVWTEVDISEGSTAIQTPRELYNMMAREFKVAYFRVPITDEQAPKVTDYDAISTIVRNTSIDTKLVFNCQMGRGRTTTGLCVATALRLWTRRELIGFSEELRNEFRAGRVSIKARVCCETDTLDVEERRYLEGNYEAVGTLQRVLEHGIVAKRECDAVIDVCDAMQNLREAIYTLKVQSESGDKSPVQRAAAYNRGVHYLRRYYQLIEFVNYLISVSPEDRTSVETFASWLQSRSELRSIVKRITLQ